MRQRLRKMQHCDIECERLESRRYCFGKSDAPAAPDYTATAAASEKAAELGAELGNKQLDESKRQYDENMKVAAPIVDAQLGLMKSQQEQGDDYYEYMKENQRPVEAKLNEEAMASGTAQSQQEAADQSEADSMRGFTKSANIVARQGARYGASADKMAQASTDMSAMQASGIASAAGAAREKDKATGYAKKMDVAGLYRNLTGASQGSYGLAIQAGNAANQNNMAPGQALAAGNAAGVGTIMQGSGQNIQGQSAILGSQTSIYNAGQSASASSSAGMGSMIGGIGGIAVAI